MERRNPMWFLSLLFSSMMVVFMIFVIFITKAAKDISKFNIIALCIYGLTGWGILLAYTIFKINKEMDTFEKLDDRHKVLDLLEDNLELEKLGNSISNRARQNIKKIQILFPKKEDK